MVLNAPSRKHVFGVRTTEKAFKDFKVPTRSMEKKMVRKREKCASERGSVKWNVLKLTLTIKSIT